VERRARVISIAVFSGLATIVAGASLTWACTGPTFGTPSAPSNPPTSTPDVSSPGSAAGPTTQVPATSSPGPVAANPSPSTGSSGAGSTSGARGPLKATGRAPATNGAPAQGFVRRGTTAAPSSGVANSQSGLARSQFAQRADGATAGVTASGGQRVFASPAAKARARVASKAARTTPSARSASGDLWNGFKPKTRASVFAAEAAGASQGSGGPMTAALVVLGLGLVGLVGSASVLGLRRRRAASATGSSSSGTTEM